jgi:hypothetical protein
VSRQCNRTESPGGQSLRLPRLRHRQNGNSCYIDSDSSPIQLKLTTGASGTLKGRRGEAETLEEKEQAMLHLFETSSSTTRLN